MNGHVDVVNALLEAGGRELLMLTADNGASCLMVSAAGHGHVTNRLGSRSCHGHRDMTVTPTCW